jgi:diguanylate cyclase (GGDEF)-like protein
MDHPSDTMVTSLARPVSERSRDACLVHIYPTGPGMGTRFPLGDADSVSIVGRGSDCEIHINDHSVSRRHARIEAVAGDYFAVDLESTNGTFVNDVPVSRRKLLDGDYLRIGNCIFRFLAGGNIEAEYHEEIYRLAIIDALTEIPNKRMLLEFLDRELARSARHARPLSVLFIDIDHFKEINDSHGHLGGDYTLRELASCVKAVVRREELFARYGGEEFVVVLPETAAETALALAERLRTIVETHPFQFEGKTYPITISLGIAATEGGEVITPGELIRRADEKMYLAKRGGRNLVIA